MKTIKFILFACLLSVTTSCNNWLNVDMEDGIMENTLYVFRSVEQPKTIRNIQT